VNAAPALTPVRGRVYWADLGYGEKPWLCVSNNGRNNRLSSLLAVRITTSTAPDLPTIVPLSPADPFVGRVLCDDLAQLFRDELRRDGGALSRQTLTRVDTGLRAALSLI
jgi:mRNA interferase MazF